MRGLLGGAAWLALFGAFLAFRFPYQAAFNRFVAEVQEATGAQLSWREARAGPLGLALKEAEVLLPSGARVGADRVRLRPAWGGLAGELSQIEAGGKARLRLRGAALELRAEDLRVDTGMAGLGTIRVSGELAYDLRSREGEGTLRMALGKLAIPLPLPDSPIEVGARVVVAEGAGEGAEVRADVGLSGEGLSGKGQVRLRSLPGGGPPALSGTLRVDSPGGQAALQLGGTWGRPEWRVLPQGGSR